MAITNLNTTYIYKLTELFCKTHPHQKASNKGRPQIYPETLILTLLILKMLYNLSYRKLLTLATQLFKDHKLPSLRDLVYRIKNIPEDRTKRVYSMAC
ncbi:MAG: transposase [Aquificaceae bacterium]